MQRLYCRPSDIITNQATISLVVGSADANYPLTNLQDLNPAKPAKTTGTTATFRATFGGAVTLEMMSFGPHNLAGATVTLTNNSGFSQAITIPANREDGLSINPFLDFATLANRNATQWNLVITGAAANIAIGEWQLITTKRTLVLAVGGAEEAETHQTIMHQTAYGARLQYSLGVAQRRFRGRIELESQRAAMLSLLRSASGPYKSFLFVPDSSVNDAYLVTLLTEEQAFTRRLPTPITTVDLEFLEVQRGLAL